MDDLADLPRVREQIAELPAGLIAGSRPGPDRPGRGSAVLLDPAGRVVLSLQRPPSRLDTVTAVHPLDGQLHLGALPGDTLLRVPDPRRPTP